jgi:hypothetical protein
MHPLRVQFFHAEGQTADMIKVVVAFAIWQTHLKSGFPVMMVLV